MPSNSSATEPSWVHSPSGRGTMDLLGACLFTMALSFFSVIHLDIPTFSVRTSRLFALRHFLNRVAWTLRGLLLPELVGSTAVTQFKEACKLGVQLEGIEGRLQNDRNEIEGSKGVVVGNKTAVWGGDIEMAAAAWQGTASQSPEYPSGKGSNSPHTETRGRRLLAWFGFHRIPHDLSRAWFILMGGFEITNESFDQTETLTLTPLGAVTLAKQNLLPFISVQEIEDKSKADVATKILVCLQAGWMILQCIARRASGLPVTLVEILTVVHLGATLVIYLAWLKKPQDVHVPTQIKDRYNILGVALRALMVHRTEARPYNPHDGKLRSGILRWDVHTGFSSDFSQGPNGATQLFGEWKQFRYTRLEMTLPQEVRNGEPRPRFPYVVLEFDGDGINLTERQAKILVNLYDFDAQAAGLPIHVLDICRDLVEERPLARYYVVKDRPPISGDLALNYNFEYYNVPSEKPTLSARFWDTALLWLAAAIQAGAYLAAWHDHFPTDIERMMWRASALFMMVLMSITRTLYFIRMRLAAWVPQGAKRFVHILFGTISSILFYMFLIARLYLFAESFAAIRSLPKGAYQNIEWVEFVPHL